MAKTDGPINVYFDLKQTVTFGVGVQRTLDPGFYYTNGFSASHIPKSLLWNADRVWMEEPNRIWWFKNAINGQSAPVDLAEFAWVKLQAKSIT